MTAQPQPQPQPQQRPQPAEMDDSTLPSLSGISNEICNVDETFRCKICHEHFKAAVMITCGHSFCSECIRTTFRNGLASLKRKASCPQCRTVFPNCNIEKVLTPNRALQESLHEWQKYLEKLKSSSSDAAKEEVSTSAGDVTTSLRSKQALKSHETKIEDIKEESKKDDVPASQRQSKRPPINYSGTKRKKLIELCKAESLPTTGTDEELRERHQLFVTLWNAEMDSLNPKTHQDIVQIVLDRERSIAAQRKKDMVNGCAMDNRLMEKIKDSRTKLGESGTKVTSGNANFDKKLKDGFENLIRQHRERNGQYKLPHGTQNLASGKSYDNAAGNPDIKSDHRDISEKAPSINNSITQCQTNDADCSNDFPVEHQPKETKPCKESNSTENSQPSSLASVDFSPRRYKRTCLAQPTLDSETPSKRARKSGNKNHIQQKRACKQRVATSWNCGRCTFTNKPSRMLCEMCNFHRSGISTSSGAAS